MIPIAELKQNLELNKSLGSVIETMKVGSAIQIREFQSKARASDKLSVMLQDCFEMISRRGSIKHPLFFHDESLPSCILLITSDDGFVGELNVMVIGAGLEYVKNPNDELVVLGERGGNYFEERRLSFVSFPGLSDDIAPSEIHSVKKYIIDGYFKRRFGRVVIVYPESTHVGSWKVASMELLPFTGFKRVSMEAGMEPSFDTPRPRIMVEEELIIEPSVDSVAEGLVELWLDVTLFNIFWSGKFSELGARLMHLEGSEQELVRMKQQLSLQYFKHVHEMADTTIREILSARIGLRQAV